MATLKEKLFGFAGRHKVLTGFLLVIGGCWLTSRAIAFSRYLDMRPQVLAWRAKYGYQSLAERLEYERPHRNAPPPALSEVSRKALEDADRYEVNSGPRAESLKLLHSESVARFVARNDEFGYSRMRSIGPSYIELRTSHEPIAFDTAPRSAAEESYASATALPEEEVANSAVKGQGDSGRAAPFSIVEARKFHDSLRGAFLTPDRFGHIESVDRVAGFASHAFTWRPDHYSSVSRNWKTVRLELLSWLKHETPRVYVSENFPQMDELASAKTRELNAFEKSALERLVAGEELETAATANRIEMVGALRAGKNCQQCHTVPYGTLLGAFTYELRRDPPIGEAPPTVTAAVQ